MLFWFDRSSLFIFFFFNYCYAVCTRLKLQMTSPCEEGSGSTLTSPTRPSMDGFGRLHPRRENTALSQRPTLVFLRWRRCDTLNSFIGGSCDRYLFYLLIRTTTCNILFVSLSIGLNKLSFRYLLPVSAIWGISFVSNIKQNCSTIIIAHLI